MSRIKSKADTSISTFTPRLTDIIFVVVFILALAYGTQMLSIDSDLGRHLTLGNYILDSRIIPTRDLFSHTLTNQPRPPYEWLSQILFAFANRLLGLDGVILFTALIIAVTFTLIFQFANRRSGSPIIAFLITFLAIGAASIHWLPRPHIITFLLLAVWIENLEQLRKGKPVKLFIFPLIMLFWANLHGGFVFGFLAWCAYVAGWTWGKWEGKADDQTGKNILWTGVISLTATIVTPNLWRNWEAVLNNRSSFILSRTTETMPPNLTTLPVLPFTLLLALTTILFIVNYKTLSASHFFLLTGFGIMSLLMARNIPLFALACTPILSEMTKSFLSHLKKAGSRIEERFSGFGIQPQSHIVPLVITFLMVAFFANQNFNKHQGVFQFDPQVFPVQAMDWLKLHPQGNRMFNEFNWGGYILYRTWPQQQVFLDSQSDFYGESLMRDYEQMMTTQGNWEKLLGKYQVDWAIVPTDSPLATILAKNQNWETIYKDDTATIIRKAQ